MAAPAHVPAPRWVRLIPTSYWGTGTKALTCPYGHRLEANATLMRGDGVLRCAHGLGPKLQCNASVWTVAGLTTPDGQAAVYVAHVLPSELARFERERWTLGQVLAYLALHPVGG